MIAPAGRVDRDVIDIDTAITAASGKLEKLQSRLFAGLVISHLGRRGSLSDLAHEKLADIRFELERALHIPGDPQ